MKQLYFIFILPIARKYFSLKNYSVNIASLKRNIKTLKHKERMKKTFYCLLVALVSVVNSLSASGESASFTEGYISSKLEDHFHADIGICVEDSKLIVYRWPECVETNEIKDFLEKVSCLEIVVDGQYDPACGCPEVETFEEGDLLPELNPFFPTMLAQPHILGYSAGYRTYDKVFKISCIPVSIGDQFSLYQFKTIAYGNLYLGIEACVWAIFEGRTKSLSLINADYFVALPLTYINEGFAARLRLFHESSHLGDEYLLENEKIVRVNPSMEVLDLSLAYDLSDFFTVFLGYSVVLRSDESYKIKPSSFYYGFNYYFENFKTKICNVDATPYISTYFTNEQNHNWDLDCSVALGYQWDKSYGHKLRVYLEGHDGFSAEGQFSKKRTNYLAVKLLYGY